MFCILPLFFFTIPTLSLVKAVRVLPGNPEIWIHLINQSKEAGESQTRLRSMLEKAVESSGGSWDSVNLWKFYAVCEVQFGCGASAVSVLRAAASQPTSGQAELQEQLQKYVDMYQPENSERAVQEARLSWELLAEIAARSRYEQELQILQEASGSSKEISRGEVATWKAYLGYMSSRGGARPLFDRCLARCTVHQQEDIFSFGFSLRGCLHPDNKVE